MSLVHPIGKVLVKEKAARPAEPGDEVKLLTGIRDSLASK